MKNFTKELDEVSGAYEESFEDFQTRPQSFWERSKIFGPSSAIFANFRQCH